MHPVRQLRNRLGLSQEHFAQLVGRSTASIRNYERGLPLPNDLLEKLVNLAVQRGFADVAVELRGGKYQVKRVVQPGETLISTKRKGGEPPSASSLGPPPATKRERKSYYHALLDIILDSGYDDAIEAVERDITVFAKYVQRGENRSSSRREKGA